MKIYNENFLGRVPFVIVHSGIKRKSKKQNKKNRQEAGVTYPPFDGYSGLVLWKTFVANSINPYSIPVISLELENPDETKESIIQFVADIISRLPDKVKVIYMGADVLRLFGVQDKLYLVDTMYNHKSAFVNNVGYSDWYVFSVMLDKLRNGDVK